LKLEWVEVIRRRESVLSPRERGRERRRELLYPVIPSPPYSEGEGISKMFKRT
jgi:hypothetical protein